MRGGEGGGVVPFLGAQEQEYYQRGGGDKIHSYTSQSGTLQWRNGGGNGG